MAFFPDLTRIQSNEGLIAFLELEEFQLRSVVDFKPGQPMLVEIGEAEIEIASIPVFFEHKIPKRRDGTRIVWETSFLKPQYKALARRLTSFFRSKLVGFPHHRSFGFVSGLNIRENAREHLGRKYLLKIDLENFFNSIGRERIEDLFVSMGIKPEVSGILSKFVTIDGSLPMGLATSPVIANVICLSLDEQLYNLAVGSNSVYTRYADDLSFSGNGELPDLKLIENTIRQNGFRIATDKTRRTRRGQAHFVTGLSISDSQFTHVPREMKRGVRQELYYAEKFGISEHFDRLGIGYGDYFQTSINRLDGLVKYVSFHEPQLASTFRARWSRILASANARPSFAPKQQSRTPFSINVDEAEFKKPDGTNFLVLAMSASQHQDQIERSLDDVLQKVTSDIWEAGKTSSYQKNGLHYAEATEDLRLSVVEAMQALPFEGFVEMAKLDSPAKYEATYLGILSSMIERRLMASESQHAFIRIESNSKVSQSKIKSTIQEVYLRLKAENNRHPLGFTITFVNKPDLGISVPDFLLGVLAKFLKTSPGALSKPIPRDHLLFERIRDKYKWIRCC
ncbi:MAG: reverse transcriptase family protein [Aestuariivirga sp.]